MRLSQATQEYVQSRNAQGYRPGTVKNDRRYLARLVTSLGDMECRKITAKHIDRTMTLLGRTNSSGALGNYHATFTKFFRWCRSRGYMKPDQDPMAERRAPKHHPRPRLIVPLAAFPALLDAAGRRHPRDRAVIALGLYTHARQSELRTLHIRDLDLDAGDILLYQHKTQSFDIMPISAELDTELRRWLTWYTNKHGALDPDWYLIPARAHMSERLGSQFTATPDAPLAPSRPINNMHDIAKLALSDCGYPLADENGKSTREGIHTLRRSAARAMFDELAEAGYDGAARTVQTMLHHASMTQTERYLQLSPDREARNRKFKGKPMFPSLVTDNVIQLREAE